MLLFGKFGDLETSSIQFFGDDPVTQVIRLAAAEERVADSRADGVRDHEVIDRDLLQGLAVIAKANGRSLVDELNAAIATYVSEQLPLKLGDAGLALFVEELRETGNVERTMSPSHS